MERTSEFMCLNGLLLLLRFRSKVHFMGYGKSFNTGKNFVQVNTPGRQEEARMVMKRRLAWQRQCDTESAIFPVHSPVLQGSGIAGFNIHDLVLRLALALSGFVSGFLFSSPDEKAKESLRLARLGIWSSYIQVERGNVQDLPEQWHLLLLWLWEC